MLVPIEEHMMPVGLKTTEILILDDMSDDRTELSDMEMRMFRRHNGCVVNL